jgi:hypothetical protein
MRWRFDNPGVVNDYILLQDIWMISTSRAGLTVRRKVIFRRCGAEHLL